MHVAIITAGGAGMFCGSCMHDNAWAKSLHQRGIDVSLIPTYTPIRVDEDNLSSSKIFFGGINVYLEFRSRLWRALPRALTGLLNSPRLLEWISRKGISNDAHELGPLTLAMLAGESGPHREDVEELVEFVTKHLRPDVVCFSNALLIGALKRLRAEFPGKLVCVLQGDDIFLDGLPEDDRRQAIELITERAVDFDAFWTHSDYYSRYMAEYLQLPIEKFRQLTLGIDTTAHTGQPSIEKNDTFTIGYFARICPEKGVHRLVDAFRLFHERHPDSRLRIGGYLKSNDQAFFDDVLRKASSLGNACEYIGSPDALEEKVEFYQSLDVLTVPTTYHEPKGLYVLESLANGVPVVQPNHGAFPELIEATAGGLLFDADDLEDLVAKWEQLKNDRQQRLQLANSGHRHTHERFNAAVMAEQSERMFRELLGR